MTTPKSFPQFPARKLFGWGAPDVHFELPVTSAAWKYLAGVLAVREVAETPSPSPESIPQQPVKLAPVLLEELRSALEAGRVREDWGDRMLHSMGKSYRDLVRARLRHFPRVPDAVVYPRSHEEVLRVLGIAAGEGVQVVPFGGGSSVVGGVEVMPRGDGDPAICLDTCLMDRILDIDDTSRLMRVQGGKYGPGLEQELTRYGYTLGHFPQSFEFSTVGGWVATRGAGQQSTRYGKIEDMVRGVRLAAPSLDLDTRVYPAHASGPDINQMIVGSEGLFGVITEVTLAIRKAPEVRDFQGYMFPSWEAGKEALREMIQKEIVPAVLRLSDPRETASFLKLSTATLTTMDLVMRDMGLQVLHFLGANIETGSLMMIGFEGDADVSDAEFTRARRVLRRHGGFPLGGSPGRKWLKERYRLPYLRDLMLDRGIMIDTLETATTWANLDRLYQATKNALEECIRWTHAEPLVFCHISHVYPDGASLYFTFVCRQEGDPIEQWQRIKDHVSATIVATGGTISHHHAVGYEHKPWMAEEHGGGLELMRALKDRVDPKGIMNPGKLF